MGPSVDQREARAGLAVVWIRRAAKSFFFSLSPSQCRIFALPLLDILPRAVCPAWVEAVEPSARKVGSLCGETVLSAYAFSDDDALCPPSDGRCDLAVTYGSDDAGLRELVEASAAGGGAKIRVPPSPCPEPRKSLAAKSVPWMMSVPGGRPFSECARVLGRAAARKVRVLTVARTLRLASKYEETERVARTAEADFEVRTAQGFKDDAHSMNAENFETLKLCPF
jgi:hypothetical protein